MQTTTLYDAFAASCLHEHQNIRRYPLNFPPFLWLKVYAGGLQLFVMGAGFVAEGFQSHRLGCVHRPLPMWRLPEVKGGGVSITKRGLFLAFFLKRFWVHTKESSRLTRIPIQLLLLMHSPFNLMPLLQRKW